MPSSHAAGEAGEAGGHMMRSRPAGSQISIAKYTDFTQCRRKALQ